jgi:hypothetical protein
MVATCSRHPIVSVIELGAVQVSLTCVLLLLLLLLPQTTVREVMSSPPVACRANATVRGELLLRCCFAASAHKMQSLLMPVGSIVPLHLDRTVTDHEP